MYLVLENLPSYILPSHILPSHVLPIHPRISHMASPVKLYIYDLSQGMARQMSMSLTGRQIDGIWHTSVVVYGHEFYYGQGIFASAPGTTLHGRPVDILDMGETYLPEDVFIEYIDSLRPVYSPEKYHLLDNNCNNFTNDVCQFLTGRAIPSYITGLPADFLQSPFGQSLRPMIDSFFSPQAHPAGPSTTAFAPAAAASVPSLAPATTSPLHTATNLSALTHHLTTNRAVVVFFTSATCGPCRMIEPEFERVIPDKNDKLAGQGRVVGVKVDTHVAFDAASQYGIRATPTFKFFLDGKEFHEFKGANMQELRSGVDLLAWTAYPPHPHTTLSLRHIPSSTDPILFSAVGNLDAVFSKLDTVAKEDEVEIGVEDREALDKAKAVLIRRKEGKPASDSASELDVDKFDATIARLLAALSLAHHFPLLDIFRLLLLESRVADFYARNPSTLVEIIQRVNSATEASASSTATDLPPKTLVLMTLRVACNALCYPTIPTTHLFSSSPASHRGDLTALLVSSLLSPDTQIRQTAASLAFDVAAWIARGRRESPPHAEDDEWEIEVASAAAGALEAEKEEEIVYRLACAMAHLLYCVPRGSAVPGLMNVLGVKEAMEKKIVEQSVKGEKVKAVCREVGIVLAKSLETGEGN